MAEEKWVTWDGLKYYDTKVKSHIDSKLIDLQNDVPSKEEFGNLQTLVTNIVEEQTDVAARVDSFQEHIDENEAAIEELRKFDLQVASDIAALQTHMEYTVKKEDLNGYATQEFVTDAIRSAELSKDVDLSDYYKKGDVDALVNDVRINVAKNETAIAGLVTKIDDVTSDVTRNHELIEELLVSVENKADEAHQHHLSDIIDYDAPDLTNYATKHEVAAVEAKVDGIVIPEVPTKVSELENDSKFITITDVPSIEGLATEQWVKNELAKIDPSIPSEYITETELLEKGYITDTALTDYAKADSIPTKTSQLTNDSNFLTEHQDISGKADKSDLEGLATEDFVTDAISNIPDPDLSNYFTKDETTSAINEAIEGIEIPEVDLASYATKAQVAEQVATKADNILFTKDLRVTHASGNFVENDSVQNMTISEIVIKLLGLTEYKPPVTPEEIIEGTPENAISIIVNETPSHMLSSSGEIVANEYSYRAMTTSEGAQDNQQDSFFYQIIDDEGTAIETGYQITTVFLDEGYLTVLIPETIDAFDVKEYDAMSGNWTIPQWTLIENPDYPLEGYIAYTADPEYEIYDGRAIRIVIK